MGNREKAITERLKRFEAEYRKGNCAAFLDAMSLCLMFDCPIPQWAINHFLVGAQEYKDAVVRTLDEAFGMSRPKGWRQQRARERNRRGLQAHMKARELVQRKRLTVEVAIEKVAQEMSMSESDVERWYYDDELMKLLRYPQKNQNTEADI